MKLTRALAVALALLPAMGIAADSVQLKAGRWTETATPASITVDGKAQPIGPDDTKTKVLCLTAAEAAEPRLYFATAEDNALCSKPSGTVAGGKIALGNSCTADLADASSSARVLKIDGTYGPERYAARASMTTKTGSAPVEILIDVVGKYEGACKGDEDPRTGTPQ